MYNNRDTELRNRASNHYFRPGKPGCHAHPQAGTWHAFIIPGQPRRQGVCLPFDFDVVAQLNRHLVSPFSSFGYTIGTEHAHTHTHTQRHQPVVGCHQRRLNGQTNPVESTRYWNMRLHDSYTGLCIWRVRRAPRRGRLGAGYPNDVAAVLRRGLGRNSADWRVAKITLLDVTRTKMHNSHVLMAAAFDDDATHQEPPSMWLCVAYPVAMPAVFSFAPRLHEFRRSECQCFNLQ